MTRDERRKHYIKKLKRAGELFYNDKETWHAEADAIMAKLVAELGYGDVAREYRKVPRVPWR